MDSKPWYLSKTIIVNAIAVAASILAGFGLDLGVTPEVQVELAVGLIAVINIVLRFVTKQPVV